MKQFKNLLFLSLILLCWTLVSCKSSKTSSGWSLIWEENFNQKKSFDSQVWSKIPRGKSDWNNYMTDFDSCYAPPAAFNLAQISIRPFVKAFFPVFLQINPPIK